MSLANALEDVVSRRQGLVLPGQLGLGQNGNGPERPLPSLVEKLPSLVEKLPLISVGLHGLRWSIGVLHGLIRFPQLGDLRGPVGFLLPDRRQHLRVPTTAGCRTRRRRHVPPCCTHATIASHAHASHHSSQGRAGRGRR